MVSLTSACTVCCLILFHLVVDLLTTDGRLIALGTRVSSSSRRSYRRSSSRRTTPRPTTTTTTTTRDPYIMSSHQTSGATGGSNTDGASRATGSSAAGALSSGSGGSNENDNTLPTGDFQIGRLDIYDHLIDKQGGFCMKTHLQRQKVRSLNIPAFALMMKTEQEIKDIANEFLNDLSDAITEMKDTYQAAEATYQQTRQAMDVEQVSFDSLTVSYLGYYRNHLKNMVDNLTMTDHIVADLFRFNIKGSLLNCHKLFFKEILPENIKAECENNGMIASMISSVEMENFLKAEIAKNSTLIGQEFYTGLVYKHGELRYDFRDVLATHASTLATGTLQGLSPINVGMLSKKTTRCATIRVDGGQNVALDANPLHPFGNPQFSLLAKTTEQCTQPGYFMCQYLKIGNQMAQQDDYLNADGHDS